MSQPALVPAVAAELPPQSPVPAQAPVSPSPVLQSLDRPITPPNRSLSPTSSSGSNKRVADSDISELVRKAKASRYNNQPPKQNDDDIANMLERDLSCAICSEVLNNPVACLDCLHNFCGSCLVPWFERSDTCPTCRRVVKDTRDNHSNTSLIESLLNLYPDMKRDPDELKELELIYKPGQKIIITNTYSDEDDDPEPEEEGEDEGITWLPCQCCITPNPHGYDCPDPIPAPDPITGPRRADVYTYRSHLHCQACPNTFPTSWKSGWKCDNCEVRNCGNMFTCNLQDYIKTATDQAASLSSDMWIEAPVPHGFRGPIKNYMNQAELSLFTSWMTTNNVTWRDVGQKIYSFLLDKHQNLIPFTTRDLGPDSFACRKCMLDLVQSNLVSWWIHERETTGYVDYRVKCWYGRECRTQTHNMRHATRLNHSCEETPASQRVNNAPPRDEAQVVGAGPAGDGDGVAGDGRNGNVGDGDGGGIGGVGGDGDGANGDGGNGNAGDNNNSGEEEVGVDVQVDLW